MAEGQRRSAGRQVRVDIAVHEPRPLPLLGEPRPEREAEIRGGAEFDAYMGAVAGDRAGVGIVERAAQSRAEAGIIFQTTDAAEDRDRRVLEIIAELRTIVVEIAERAARGDAAHAETQRAAFGADKHAVREIVARH